MDVKKAEFVSSYTRESMCPKDGRPEFAFIGRSNVGKSSLINMLTGRKGLAKVSGTPGKTQLLNYFNINDSWYLVDLPGYGYAKVSKSQQRTLAKMIEGYLIRRAALVSAFVLIDSNIPPTQTDLEFINQLGEYNVPFAILFTKTDRVKKGNLDQNIEDFLEALKETWETLPPYFRTSSVYSTGKTEVLDYIAQILKTLPS
ncbi:MAG: YihA family ribosome biogenesis GTP-binding protein [Lewinellaceae bacterium]|nr:YihA family ribosome biogenesis GTP-binding protein [Saprospiraceae bacterium]MCB9330757.1 YihA family ribosome biogenesis GTP-binding protein [Lewinellaceae bacterium]